MAVALFSILSFTLMISFAGPAILAAWLLTLVLPYEFSQIIWLCLGIIVIVAFIIGDTDYNLQKHTTTLIASYALVVVITLSAWLSFSLLGLSLFEATALFTVSLLSGLLIVSRIVDPYDNLDWLFEDDDIDDDFKNEVIVTPSKRRKQRRAKH